jgi:hypothetical protein
MKTMRKGIWKGEMAASKTNRAMKRMIDMMNGVNTTAFLIVHNFPFNSL